MVVGDPVRVVCVLPTRDDVRVHGLTVVEWFEAKRAEEAATHTLNRGTPVVLQESSLAVWTSSAVRFVAEIGRHAHQAARLWTVVLRTCRIVPQPSQDGARDVGRGHQRTPVATGTYSASDRVPCDVHVHVGAHAFAACSVSVGARGGDAGLAHTERAEGHAPFAQSVGEGVGSLHRSRTLVGALAISQMDGARTTVPDQHAARRGAFPACLGYGEGFVPTTMDAPLGPSKWADWCGDGSVASLRTWRVCSLMRTNANWTFSES